MNFVELSNKYGLSVEEITKVESDLRKKYAGVASIMSAEQIEQYILGGIAQYANRFKSLGLTQYYGIVLTMSSPKDGMVKKRSEAIKKYVEDPDAAITFGYVQEYKNGMKRALVKDAITSKAITTNDIPKTAVYLPDQKAYIVPLDNLQSWPSGKKNFNYLKPLPLEQFFSNITGYASIDGRTWNEFKMTFNCDEHINVPNVTVPMSKLIKFFSKVKKTGEVVELSFNSKYTKFDIIDGDITVMDQLVMNYMNHVELSNIEAVYAARKTNYDIVSVFGSILYKRQKEASEDKPFPWITAAIMDNTRDTPLKLLIHPDMIASFDDQSIVKVWGSLSEGNKWDPETSEKTDEKEITMFVTGIYVFNGKVETPIEEQKTDDGWEE